MPRHPKQPASRSRKPIGRLRSSGSDQFNVPSIVFPATVATSASGVLCRIANGATPASSSSLPGVGERRRAISAQPIEVPIESHRTDRRAVRTHADPQHAEFVSDKGSRFGLRSRASATQGCRLSLGQISQRLCELPQQAPIEATHYQPSLSLVEGFGGRCGRCFHGQKQLRWSAAVTDACHTRVISLYAGIPFVVSVLPDRDISPSAICDVFCFLAGRSYNAKDAVL